jgi:hypothetical protein
MKNLFPEAVWLNIHSAERMVEAPVLHLSSSPDSRSDTIAIAEPDILRSRSRIRWDRDDNPCILLIGQLILRVLNGHEIFRQDTMEAGRML